MSYLWICKVRNNKLSGSTGAAQAPAFVILTALRADYTGLTLYSVPHSVRPTKMSLTGVKHHTVQGTKVLLQCQVSAERSLSESGEFVKWKAMD